MKHSDLYSLFHSNDFGTHSREKKNKHSKFHSDTPSDNFSTPGYHLEDTLICPPKSQDAFRGRTGWVEVGALPTKKYVKEILVVTTITGMGDNPKGTPKKRVLFGRKFLHQQQHLVKVKTHRVVLYSYKRSCNPENGLING